MLRGQLGQAKLTLLIWVLAILSLEQERPDVLFRDLKRGVSRVDRHLELQFLDLSLDIFDYGRLTGKPQLQ